jgi:short-subunit dehydrogenase
VEALGLSVDVLVMSAGFGMGGPFLQQDPSRVVQMARTNLESVSAFTHAFVPAMVARRRGAVLVVSSMAGYQPVLPLSRACSVRSYAAPGSRSRP